tara:strand:+ start:283 stop:651 length:369 start_codon:yes stop_codon:yes gene_type:complete
MIKTNIPPLTLRSWLLITLLLMIGVVKSSQLLYQQYQHANKNEKIMTQSKNSIKINSTQLVAKIKKKLPPLKVTYLNNTITIIVQKPETELPKLIQIMQHTTQKITQLQFNNTTQKMEIKFD